VIQVQKDTGLFRVEEYGLAEWLAEVQTMIKKGYEFDFVTNSNYPVQIGTIYSAIMVPIKDEVPVDEPVVQPKVDGRKKKV